MVRAAVVAAAVVLVSSVTATVALQAQQTVIAGIDVDTAGNQADSLGDIQNCRTVEQGDTFQIDVFAMAVPPSSDGAGGVTGFSYNLLFDPEVVEVTAVDNNLLLTVEGVAIPFEVIDTDPEGGTSSDPLPATTGDLRVDFADLSKDAESGDGTLSRLTLKAVGSGLSNLFLSPVEIFDLSAEVYPNVVENAAVAVGEPCTPPRLTAPQADRIPADQATSATSGQDGGGETLNTPGATPPVAGDADSLDEQAGALALAIDAIPANNTATSVGQIDTCAAADEGDSFIVDVVIEDVTNLLAWEMSVFYDPDVLEVIESDTELFQAANEGSQVFDLSEETPDDDGRYLLQSVDTSEPASPDTGSGVLARLTFRAKGPGVSRLTIDKVDLNDDGTLDHGPLLRNEAAEIIGDVDGDTLFDGPASGAEIRVGQPCPGQEGTVSTVQAISDGGTSVALVLGVVVGGLAAGALTIGLAFVLLQRRRAPQL